MQFRDDRRASRAWQCGACLLATCILATAALPGFHLSPAGATSPGAEILIDAKIVSVRVSIA